MEFWIVILSCTVALKCIKDRYEGFLSFAKYLFLFNRYDDYVNFLNFLNNLRKIVKIKLPL